MEDEFPYFEDYQLKKLLEIAKDDVRKASYLGCLRKAQNSSMRLGRMDIASNEKMWIRRARLFAKNSTGKSINRVDET